MTESPSDDQQVAGRRVTAATQDSMAVRIANELPYLRRYSRALTGQQSSGDHYAAATIEALLADRSLLEVDPSPRIVLFRAFHSLWESSGARFGIEPVGGDVPRIEQRAQRRLAGLTTNTREALLLFTVEDFDRDDIARIMQITAEEADELLKIAYRETQGSIPGTVLIIEDEPLIAMDIRSIVEDMGHQVVGVAPTRTEAVRLARESRPDLVLADIQLADNSSGIDAVNDILGLAPETPAIFITAFPERLLTGQCPEPAFLIAKPFTEERVRSAVSQAMFFASTETLFS